MNVLTAQKASATDAGAVRPDRFTGREFRDALSTFATGVTIVTTHDAEGAAVGMTASSFNSVSLDPPLILWSVTKTALSAPSFVAARHFSVHVLASDQSHLSNRFARSGTDKFAETEHELDERGVPIIAGSVSRFDCSTWAIHDGGDHHIIIGRVEAIANSAREGLIFGGGTYATATPLVAADDGLDDMPEGGGPVDGLLLYHLSRAYHQMGVAFHEAVRGSGLTVAEWRISASLFGETRRSIADLRRRTFLDPNALDDILAGMAAEGLCTIEGSDVTGTKKGHETVAHLFHDAEAREAAALADVAHADRKRLMETLRRIGETTGTPD